MTDHKIIAAKACLQFLEPGQIIGLGAGSTITHLVNLIAEVSLLSESLTFVSSSFKTRSLLLEKGLHLNYTASLSEISIYFDGCDQFDLELNALKSGGGIHTSEKLLAAMAQQFILIGDDSKRVNKLDHTYPVVLEILPEALKTVSNQVQKLYPDVVVTLRNSTQKDGAVISDHGNFLVDLHFRALPELSALNTSLKMIPGVVEHSLFYGMASKAVISGAHGIEILAPEYQD